jgi:hypothetical protein
MALKKASLGTTRLDIGEGDWLEVRTDISKRERNKLATYLPDRMVGDSSEEERRLTTGEAVELQTGLFAALVVGWSAELPCTVEEYLSLEPEDTDRIDTALAEHWKSLQPTKAEAKAAFRPRGAAREGSAN